MPLITGLHIVPQTHVRLEIRVRFTAELLYKKEQKEKYLKHAEKLAPKE